MCVCARQAAAPQLPAAHVLQASHLVAASTKKNPNLLVGLLRRTTPQQSSLLGHVAAVSYDYVTAAQGMGGIGATTVVGLPARSFAGHCLCKLWNGVVWYGELSRREGVCGRCTVSRVANNTVCA